MKIEGGCLCGQVRYQADTEPVFQAICHCRDCLKSTGAGYFPGLGVSKTSLTITGELTAFAKAADSGATATRRFCPVCGTTVMDENGSGISVLAAGTLDDPSLFRPQFVVFARSRPHWGALAMPLEERGP